MTDLFGRLRVSNPYTLFYNTFTTDNRPLEMTSDNSGGSLEYLSDESSMKLSTSNNGDIATIQSRNYAVYQPGKSFQVLVSGVLDASNGNDVVTRIGYFDDDNGYFFKHKNGIIYACERSSTIGDTEIPSTDWNIGTRVIRPDQAQIFYIGAEWLGVGNVEMGFFSDGNQVIVHKFKHDNRYDKVYTKNFNLPIRAEIEAEGVDSSGSMKLICCTVNSEGGYNDLGRVLTVPNVEKLVDFSTEEVPILSLRQQSNQHHNLSVQEMKVINAAQNLVINTYMYKAPADPLTNAVWNDVSYSTVQYDFSATDFDPTGSYLLSTDYITSSQTILNKDLNLYTNNTITTDICGGSDYYVITGKAIGGPDLGLVNVKIRDFY